MIKLVISDMDGSLLNGKKELPPDFFEVFEALQEKGIIFAVASGRTYLTLLQHFKAIADKIPFISDNGTNIYLHNECIYRKSMTAEGWRRAAQVCEGRKGVAAIVNGACGDYILPYKHDASLASIIDGGFAALRVVHSMAEVKDDVYKIGICDKAGPQNGLYDDICAVCGSELDAVISGPNYMDVMAAGANKGSALKILQEKLGITKEETMAFGDFYNDVGMLQNASFGFVMENAPEDMREHANNMAKSNEHYGVTHAIKKYILSV